MPRKMRRNIWCDTCGMTQHRVIEVLDEKDAKIQRYRWRCTKCGRVTEGA